MKKQIWNNGTRDLWGSDLTMIQDELQQAIEDGLFEDIGICVISDIGITSNSPLTLDGTGYVYLTDASGLNGKICKVPAFTAIGDVVYLTLTSVTTTDTYGDGSTQPVWIDYIANVSEAAPAHANYIKIDTGEVEAAKFKEKIVEDYPSLISSTVSTANLDTLKTPGKYRMSASAVNNPSGNLGHLFVMVADLTTQQFIDNAGNVFVRTFQGSWSAWTTVTSISGNSSAIAQSAGTVLTVTPSSTKSYNDLKVDVLVKVNTVGSVPAGNNDTITVTLKKNGIAQAQQSFDVDGFYYLNTFFIPLYTSFDYSAGDILTIEVSEAGSSWTFSYDPQLRWFN